MFKVLHFSSLRLLGQTISR